MSEREIFIREAEDDDLPDMLALYAQPGLDDGKVLPPEEAAAMFAQFARYPYYELYVAMWDGRIVGTYALLVMHNLGHLGTPSAIAEDVVVDAACQGQGTGAAMMRHAMAEARKARCYKRALSSNAKRVRAHEFYEKLGFTRHGFSFRIDLNAEERSDPAAFS